MEMALGLLVAITALLFGIYFAELGYVSLRVQQAAVAPLWDATNGRMHDLWNGPPGQKWRLWRHQVRPARDDARARFVDFQGLSSRTRGRVMTQATGRFGGMSVDCRAEEGAGAAPPGGVAGARVPYLGPPNIPGNPFPDGASAMSCSAQAWALTINIPRVFLDSGGRGGFFRVPHGHYRIALCAAGLPRGGNCPGSYGLLLDDWGAVGWQEGQDCGLYSCNNTVFRDMTRDVYTANGRAQGNAASQLAAWVTGHNGSNSPIDENEFFFSAQLQERNFTERLKSSHGDIDWDTTPFGPSGEGPRDSFDARVDGFLGVGGVAQAW